ncbi:MAG: HU family DNA-binding protein [Aggregatilineales bacterium]
MDKYHTIRQVGERTRLRNHDIQRFLEALIAVWSDELANGGRIEIENFLVLEVQTIKRQGNLGTLLNNGRPVQIPRTRRELKVRPSKHLRARIKQTARK